MDLLLKAGPSGEARLALRRSETAIAAAAAMCTASHIGMALSRVDDRDQNDRYDFLTSMKTERMDGTWTIADAKARFSDLLKCARSQGPQMVTRRGQAAAIVVSPEEWERKTRRAGNLADFLAASPLRGSGLETERRGDRARPVDL